VRLLIDTHVVLWGLNEPRRIAAPAARAMASPRNQCFVSFASLWEIAIKSRNGKLAADDDLPKVIEANRQLTLLPITLEHCWGVRRLPRLHGDPFDQLLIAQAMSEDMTLVTHDRAMSAYGVPIIAT
jgi:PIN domain nuclease of toxin-antitoxin system